eukprot:1160723-Pelagomonas_calceolata.AAC.1
MPDAKDPFHNSLWLSVKSPRGQCRTATPLDLTNLKDELKAHMHNKHKRGSADVYSCYYTGWQHLMQPPSHNSNTNTDLPKLSPKLANQKISNSFWSIPKVTLKQQINLLKYRTGIIHRITLSALITPLAPPLPIMWQYGQHQSYCPRMFTPNMPRDVIKQTQHCAQSLLRSPEQRCTWFIKKERKEKLCRQRNSPYIN